MTAESAASFLIALHIGNACFSFFQLFNSVNHSKYLYNTVFMTFNYHKFLVKRNNNNNEAHPADISILCLPFIIIIITLANSFSPA